MKLLKNFFTWHLRMNASVNGRFKNVYHKDTRTMSADFISWLYSSTIIVALSACYDRNFQVGNHVLIVKYKNNITLIYMYLKLHQNFVTAKILLLTLKRFWKTVSALTLSRRRPLSYRNQSIDLGSKSMDWFLYGNGLRLERVNLVLL